MSLAAAPAPRTPQVLADLVTPARPRVLAVAVDAALVLTGAALVALTAQLTVPFWPVPLTAQTLAVLLIGTALGPVRGAGALALYVLVGVLGLPVFAGGAHGSLLALTSGGYLVGFVVAAALVGWLARRAWDRRLTGMLVAFLAGTATIYAVGLPWLYLSLQHLGAGVWHGAMGFDTLLGATLGAGLMPFLLGDLVKAIAAAVLVPLAWRGVRALDARRR